MTTFQEKLYRKFDGDVKKIVECLKPYDPERILIFGSWAKGDFHECSDIDVVVIKDTRERFLDRIGAVLSLLDATMAVDVFVYTPREFRTMQDCGSAFVRTIIEEGKIIYEKPKPV